ncbi:cyclic pyranopterin phosphate synthase [Boudabousia tangfeifanii]|uniref:GTP 3',8-cyclase n=1 Tax=Boudabousia tangfeifanii TaxID=1912795 RepID=A0A1D9MLL3_9ACTO|nr:GTP 3',8-cyclase MoaA [Boudabousia tangfeifanii]AOZ73050.1 cyclic pyranopterin phosphate synthase [Boudabousia tangfeifanii]
MKQKGQSLQLTDKYGRVATDLRVSLTDRCNLRCTYCMPAEGLDWTAKEEILTDEEILRLLNIAVNTLGITKIRFTGGEPLLRRSLVTLVAEAAKLSGPNGRPELSLTTNALGLDKQAEQLAQAGLDRVNISLDSVDRQTYARLARRDRLPDVLKGIAAAKAAGLTPIKINTVAMKDQNLTQAEQLLTFCLEHGYQLRFIEHMPLGPRHTWDLSKVATAAEIIEILETKYQLRPRPNRGSAPAELWDVFPREAIDLDGMEPLGSVGIIASVTRPFCGDCDRTRLTADGSLRSCLFSLEEFSLRDLMRGGASDEELATAWAQTMWQKPAGHGIHEVGFEPPKRTMSAIGG